MVVLVGLIRKPWLECVSDDMKRVGLRRDMTHDRTEWRSAIYDKRCDYTGLAHIEKYNKIR